jgi:hypothetical protein
MCTYGHVTLNSPLSLPQLVGKEAKRMKKHFFFQKRREGKGDGEFIDS